MNVLIVEDDDSVRDALEGMIGIMGHQGHAVATVEAAREAMTKRDWTLAILDMSLPDGTGKDLLAEFQMDPRMKGVPVIMLTSDHTIDSKLAAFGLGAQDYVCKPFEMRELMARIEVLTRRSSGNGNLVATPGGGSYDEVEKVLSAGPYRVTLTQNEDKLFRALISSTSDAVSKPDLYKQIWGDRRVGARNLDTLVNYLRKKIVPAGLEIKSIYGVGYQLTAESGAAGKNPQPQDNDATGT